MEKSRLTTRILMEIENLIDRSITKNGEPEEHLKEFHLALVKRHYNAACVAIDYHRHRIKMDVIVNDQEYNPLKVNLVMTTVPVNLFYINLEDFLKSCLGHDVKSLAFYAGLIQAYAKKDVALLAV